LGIKLKARTAGGEKGHRIKRGRGKTKKTTDTTDDTHKSEKRESSNGGGRETLKRD